MSIVFKCSEDTIQRAVKKHYKENFSVVFGEKRLRGFVSLRRRIWTAALNGNTALLIFLSKQYLGMADQTVVRLPGQPARGDEPKRDLSRLTDEELDLQLYLSAVAQGERLTPEQLALQRRLNAIAADEPADGGKGSSNLPQ
jgi:hypothetical protein